MTKTIQKLFEKKQFDTVSLDVSSKRDQDMILDRLRKEVIAETNGL